MRPIAIGESDFKRIIEEDCMYVDKSLFIQDIIREKSPVLLITRPRRFGKTLNLSMLKYFFELANHSQKNLFKGLAISTKTSEYMQYQGQYHVIFITFKDLKFPTWKSTYDAIQLLIQELYIQFKEIYSHLEIENRQYFNTILERTGTYTDYSLSLKQLIHFLAKVSRKKVIVLIDEYDLPIQQGFLKNFYTEVIDFMRVFLGAALKDNYEIEKAVLSGVLRIAKESIFSGLNNLHLCSIMASDFQSYFGLTESEVENLLQEYNLSEQKEQVKSWFDGYQFGTTPVIYNPWSVSNYLKKHEFDAYWANTSGHDLIQDLLTRSLPEIKQDMEMLFTNQVLWKEINENISFPDIQADVDSIWSLFVSSGYLKIIRREGKLCGLAIPNREIRIIFEDIVNNWFRTKIGSAKVHSLLNNLTSGDIPNFQALFTELVNETFSLFDLGKKTAESFYHAFVLGLLVQLQTSYEIRSNRESGLGRYDISMIPKNKQELGIIIEFKIHNPDDQKSIEETAQQALRQIEEKHYEQELKTHGISRIMKLAIVFEGKKVLVVKHN